jgi:hypothetical protein
VVSLLLFKVIYCKAFNTNTGHTATHTVYMCRYEERFLTTGNKSDAVFSGLSSLSQSFAGYSHVTAYNKHSKFVLKIGISTRHCFKVTIKMRPRV